MNDNPYHNKPKSPLGDAPQQKNQPNTPAQPFSDGLFSIAITEDMAIRNVLRAGLVDAQGRASDRIPMLVSWPNWLDDGIVCLYARDLAQVLDSVVNETAAAVGSALGVEDLTAPDSPGLPTPPRTQGKPSPAFSAVPAASSPEKKESPIHDASEGGFTSLFGMTRENASSRQSSSPRETTPSGQTLADQLMAERRKQQGK